MTEVYLMYLIPFMPVSWGEISGTFSPPEPLLKLV